MPSTMTDIEKLGGAITTVADEHKKLAEQLREEIKARVDVGDWPSIKARLDKFDTTVKELTEVKDALDQLDRTVKLAGGNAESNLMRQDPGYHAPWLGRSLPNADVAKVLALTCHFAVNKSDKVKDQLEELGAPVVRVDDDARRASLVSDDASGGLLLQPELVGVLIGALGNYGVAPQFANLLPMRTREALLIKDAKDFQIHAIDEGQPITEESRQYSMVKVEAKEWAAFAAWSASYERYGLINQGEQLAAKFTRAIAKRMDEIVFTADGTSTFNGFRGLLEHPDIAATSLPATKTAYTDTTYDDLITLMSAVTDEVYEEGRSRYFMSGSLFWVMKNIKDAQGRPLFTDAREGGDVMIVGENVTRTAVMPRVASSAAGKKFVAFGDLSRAYTLGVATEMQVDFSKDWLFGNAKNAIRILSRFGSVATWPDAIKLLKTADS